MNNYDQSKTLLILQYLILSQNTFLQHKVHFLQLSQFPVNGVTTFYQQMICTRKLAAMPILSSTNQLQHTKELYVTYHICEPNLCC